MSIEVTGLSGHRNTSPAGGLWRCLTTLTTWDSWLIRGGTEVEGNWGDGDVQLEEDRVPGLEPG